MSWFARGLRTSRPLQLLIGLAVGGIGAAALSAVTSQGYLHAATVTGAGYTGSSHAVGPEEQLLMLLAWILIGGIAGFAGRSPVAFAGLWVGALAGSALGFMADPAGNILFVDVIVTIVGVSLFVTPGFFLGAAIAGRWERNAPDGSGRRPTPPPLWTRGGGVRPARATTTRPAAPTAEPNHAAYAPPSYARPPGSRRSE